MSPNDFVQRFQSEWREIEDLTVAALAWPMARFDEVAESPARFRRLCPKFALPKTWLTDACQP